MFRLVFFVLLLFGAAGCSGPQALGTGPRAIGVVDADALPPPAGIDTFAVDPAYVIGPLDKLTVEVFGLAEFDRQNVQVDLGGNVSLPLVGTIMVAGRTPEQVRADVEQRLRAAYIRDPKASVNVEEAVSRSITVDGEVRTPGIFPVTGKMTLMRAVARAQGLSEFAKIDDVVVFRTVGGRKLAALYNLGAVRRGSYPDPDIYPNDVVVVGQSQARRLFKDLLAASTLVTTPLIIALQ